jgi:chemotaxis protein CheX
MSPLVAVGAHEVAQIAQEFFEAMIDREPGLLTPWSHGPITVAEPLYAWVGLGTAPASRLQLSTGADTAGALTRALLSMTEAEPVADDDVVDAFGEIANVLGGNVKALLAEHVGMTLPEVSRQVPPGAGGVRACEGLFAWRGGPLVISLYTIRGHEPSY